MSAEAILSAITVVLLILRFVDGFATKKESKGATDGLMAQVEQYKKDAKKLIDDQTIQLRGAMTLHADNTEKKLSEVLEQAQKTNGRVTTLELWKTQQEAAKAGVAEYLASISTVVPIINATGARRSTRNRKAK